MQLSRESVEAFLHIARDVGPTVYSQTKRADVSTTEKILDQKRHSDDISSETLRSLT